LLSRGFGINRLRTRVAAVSHPLMDFASHSEFDAAYVLPYWFGNPTSSLDLSSTLWFSAGGGTGNARTIPVVPLLGFGGPPESWPVDPSRCGARRRGPGSSHELRFPSALAGVEDPPLAGLPDPLGSAFRVWLPSWRLSPLGTSPALFHADSAPGIFDTLRSFPLSKGTRGHYASRWTRLPFSQPYCRRHAEACQAGPAGRGSQALTLPRVPGPA